MSLDNFVQEIGSEDQSYKLICFKQDCFLFLSLGHTGPELSACYFSGIF